MKGVQSAMIFKIWFILKAGWGFLILVGGRAGIPPVVKRIGQKFLSSLFVTCASLEQEFS